MVPSGDGKRLAASGSVENITRAQSQPESEREVTGVRTSEVRTRKQKKGVREQV